MQPSPLNLLHYYLLALNLEPEEGYEVDEPSIYPDIGNAKFETKVEFGVRSEEDDNNDFTVKLYLRGEPEESGSFPYSFNIGVQGFFSLRPEFETDNKREFVLVNGATILYGILRDTLKTLTSRFDYGPIMIPTVNFLNLKGKLDECEYQSK